MYTSNNPWTPARGTPARHPQARKVGAQEDGWLGGDIVTYRCPACGHTWREELPQ